MSISIPGPAAPTGRVKLVPLSFCLPRQASYATCFSKATVPGFREVHFTLPCQTSLQLSSPSYTQSLSTSSCHHFCDRSCQTSSDNANSDTRLGVTNSIQCSTVPHLLLPHLLPTKYLTHPFKKKPVSATLQRIYHLPSLNPSILSPARLQSSTNSMEKSQHSWASHIASHKPRGQSRKP